MYDCFFRWATIADAKADLLWAARKYSTQDSTGGFRSWALDRTLPNVKAWRVSQDSTLTSSSVDPHNYLTGFFAIVALDTVPQVVMNSTALAFALNRDWRAASTSTDGPPAIPLIVKNNIGAVISDVGVSPIFAGSNYPIGGYST